MGVTAPLLRRARSPRTGTVTSAVYAGEVRHARFAPVDHAFTYRMAMTFLRLDEVDEVLDRHPLWSRRRGRPVRDLELSVLVPRHRYVEPDQRSQRHVPVSTTPA